MTTRRSFIKKSATGLLGFTYIPHFLSRIAPSDKVQVAHIGINGMGSAHLRWFSELPEVDVVALCDVDQKHLKKALLNFKEYNPNKKAGTYEDFRQILDRKDIDAVTIATPDHWHAQIASLAFESGKDVYGEKPLSYDIEEGEMMLRYKQKNNRIFQLGTQIHAGDNYHRVAELVQSGVIGEVKTVRLWKPGDSPVLVPSKNANVPMDFNYDMWLGPAPFEPYFPERVHFNYRYFLDYSGGMFADFWCHIADIVYMSLNPKNLRKVSAKGEELEGAGDTPAWLDADFEYDNLTIHWTTKPPQYHIAPEWSIGAIFEGTKGKIMCNYGKKQIEIDGKFMDELPDIPKTITRSPGHQQNFIDSVKSRQEPESNLEYAAEMTRPMHLALISYRLGRPVEWDPIKKKFIKDRKANKLRSRKPRKGWRLIK